MRYYVGVDWADAAHAIWVVDEAGGMVTKRTVAHSAEGLSEWSRELDEWRAQGIELWAAIERPEGRVVDFLLDHGVVVYPLNPKALDRARDRFRQSGAKSDPFDARVAADFLRTDQGHLTALQPSSTAAQELKYMTEDCQRLIRQQTRLLNQLTATLKAYYPRGLEVAELPTALARAFLAAYPTPEALSQLTGVEVFNRQVYYFDKIPTEIQPGGIVLLNLGALAIAILFSVLPAFRAALLHPVKALRYE